MDPPQRDLLQPTEETGEGSGSEAAEMPTVQEPRIPAIVLKPPPAKPKKSRQKKVVAYNPTSVLDQYIDIPPEMAKGPGGAKPDPLLDLVSSHAYLKSDPAKKKIVRCAGAAYGCDHTAAAPRWKQRVFSHAVMCAKLDKVDATLRDQVRTAMAQKSLGERVESTDSLEQDHQQPPLKRTKTLPSDIPTAAAAGASGGTASGLKQSSVFPASRKARIAKLKDQLDFDVLKLVCVGGMPPSKVDSKEWKTMWKHGNPDYEPASAAVLTESQIPNEAARVADLVLELLRRCDNLTITFDGNTTKLPESVYTIHVITPDRRVFLIEGDESSAESHTGEKIHQILKAVRSLSLPYLKHILTPTHRSCFESAPNVFARSHQTTVNTGNTTLGRGLTKNDFLWIIILPDSCHRMNSLCKDIGQIEFFKPVCLLFVYLQIKL